ncbi:group III truncated hemoglobin [Sphingopyxis sp.]|jgi:hemoglobin|uniref:group III truncated hemoglobin n=1 Tax=Sphingopyxis sp. TaxID=1908224 RepID=UPI003F730EC6
MTDPILSEQDLARVIPAFYARVRDDEILGPIFNNAIGDWPHHLDKLQAFWSSVMMASGRYKGQPMVAHLRHATDMTGDNFARWLLLWAAVTSELLGAEAADAMQLKAAKISESLQLGMQFHRERTPTP